MAKIIKLELIETEEPRGEGTTESPSRLVKRLYSPDGDCVLEYDVYQDQTTMTANLLAHLGWIPKA
jgi:hypothetical protein